MTREEIFTELKAIIKLVKPHVDTEALTQQTRLIEDLGLDSLTILLLSFAIEKKFEFKFDGAPKFASVGEVMDYIETHKA